MDPKNETMRQGVFPTERRRKMAGRKRYSREFKARVALDAVKGRKTASELSSEYGVHADQTAGRKKRLPMKDPVSSI